MKCQATTLLDENLICEFKRKNSFTLSKSWLKTEQFLLTVKQKKTSLQLWFGYLMEKKLFNPSWSTFITSSDN